MAEAVLDAMLAYHRATGCYPGALVHVERDRRVLARRVFGTLHGEGDEPMREDARFRVASLTKPVVSLAIGQLLAERRVELDAPVHDYVPALRALRLADGRTPLRAPSVRDCLRHTSGLAYSNELRELAQLEIARRLDLDSRLHQLDSASVIDTLAQWPLAFEPGSAFRYGFSTDVLGLVIESVCGQRLGEALEARVFAPLGMRSTRFGLAREDRAAFATAFAADRAWHGLVGRYAAGDELGTPFHSGGAGLVTTLDDYARFARVLAHGGQIDGVRVLDAAGVDAMFIDQLGPVIDGPFAYTGPGFGFGLGLAVRLATGATAFPCTVGEGTWSGVTGAALFVQPRERWFALSLTCNMSARLIARFEFRRAVAALQ